SPAPTRRSGTARPLVRSSAASTPSAPSRTWCSRWSKAGSKPPNASSSSSRSELPPKNELPALVLRIASFDEGGDAFVGVLGLHVELLGVGLVVERAGAVGLQRAVH